MTQAGICQVVVWIISTLLTLFRLPQTDWFLCSPPACLKFPFCPSLFPHCEEAFLSVGTSPHFQVPTKGDGSYLFPLLFFFQWYGDFSYSFRCTKLHLLVFNRCSVRSVLLIYSWCTCEEGWIPCPPILPSWFLSLRQFLIELSGKSKGRG